MDLGEWIAICLRVIVLVWYVVAGFDNRRRGIRDNRWLLTGLKNLGVATGANWIGT